MSVVNVFWMRHGRARLWALFLCLALIILAAGQVWPALGQSRDQTTTALLATVQVVMPDDAFDGISLGSGTVMNDTGLILTNHHVVAGEASNGLMNESALALIAISPDDLRGESVLKYFGEVVKIDPELDLALIQINALLDDPNAPLPANLGLTPIPRGDSDSLMIADTINIFGYPGIGGNTPTLTRGLVSGFLDEDRNGIYEWIKTDAVLSSGNSGGLATNDQGEFVGVPTAGRFMDASQLGLVRSGQLALDFVDSYFPAPVDPDGPAVSAVQFGTGVNRRNEVQNPSLRFAPGTTDLYAAFQHRNFSNGRPFAAIWRLDGTVLARDEFQWDGGANGSNWVSIRVADGFPAGYLELELLYNNQAVYKGGVTLGESSVAPPVNPGDAFGPITFALSMAGSQPIEPATSFAALDKVYAVFEYNGMNDGTNWQTRWYLNGSVVLEQAGVWDGGPTGTYWVTLSHPNGLPAGQFALELYIEDQLVQRGEFTVTGAAGALTRSVNVTGTLHDRDNSRRVIAGALVLVLEPGNSPQDWLNRGMSAEAVVATGTTNRQGVYRLDNPLVAGTTYPIVIIHDQYRTVALAGHLIPEDAADPYRLDVEMQRN